ncbi:U6 small nuclear RNA (adenine-(43)-N(6))-methyltransferase isoform X1 [Benincasa hispida]|uniref:U6 small nuclear RNA (adenine-(43)-N(6))-methyltransferase isoform X1 n=1 Tax=Benincasa hispida TaxID=102211 RepID=UPI0018FFBC70|nr:U6 small nuclear RNA (adenine-(43)-N(6))-methyltransferase isoform X1 [Benincasa hispida]
MTRKKRKTREAATIHPRNKYAENPPDFALLASLYPSFQPFVFLHPRPRIDWTDFNATRELTRVLLLHDHALHWWIPDGQLCPTVPNRSNYIHWLEDLLSSDIVAKKNSDSGPVRGLDIGTGANCIYPLLGASLLGWSFVGTDVTDVALEWAERNVKSNPHVSELIEIRKVDDISDDLSTELHNSVAVDSEFKILNEKDGMEVAPPLPSSLSKETVHLEKRYHGPPILLGVVKDGEEFDFCMCNPPFFESMDEAGLNPKTSCGGTPQEMVCPGGERAFISRMIEDSIVLRQTFRWYTSMIGKKSNLSFLISKLWKVGVTVVKTTEFVQGQICRWGLAWSFMPTARKIISPHVTNKSVMSFMLEVDRCFFPQLKKETLCWAHTRFRFVNQIFPMFFQILILFCRYVAQFWYVSVAQGLLPQVSATSILQSVERFLSASGASCKLNTSSFTVDITASEDHCRAILKNRACEVDKGASSATVEKSEPQPSSDLCFRVSVFQQIPGSLLVKGSLHHKSSPSAGSFSLIFHGLEEFLKAESCKEKVL